MKKFANRSVLMKNTFGNNITVTLFGESHGAAIGAVLDGLAPGIKISSENIAAKMKKRLSLPECSTARTEPDEVEILSGVKDGYTTGTPIAVMIRNRDVKRGDYSELASLPRPSHADLTARYKYGEFADLSGGGHFSGRLTAPIVALGAIAADALSSVGIEIGSHLLQLGSKFDRSFENVKDDIAYLAKRELAVLDPGTEADMRKTLVTLKKEGDSTGGVIECAVCGLPRGLGEPWFDTVESLIAHAMLAVPGCKGVEFGLGFALAGMRGSEANDSPSIDGTDITYKTNNGGGADGGITNGMPLIFRAAFKPTPSIALPQDTVDLSTMENRKISVHGRHDPAIVHRAAAAVEALTALVIADLYVTKFGTDSLGGRK